MRVWDEGRNSQGGGRLGVLATLIDAYKNEHYPIDPSDSIEAINFRNEQQALTRRDLEGMLGARARVAGVFRSDLIQTRCSRRRLQGWRDLTPLNFASVSSKRVGRGTRRAVDDDGPDERCRRREAVATRANNGPARSTAKVMGVERR